MNPFFAQKTCDFGHKSTKVDVNPPGYVLRACMPREVRFWCWKWPMSEIRVLWVMGNGPPTPALRPSQQGQAAPCSPPAGKRHKKKADLPNDPTYPTGYPRLPHLPSHIPFVLTHVLRTRAHSSPWYWLLCHMGEY